MRIFALKIAVPANPCRCTSVGKSVSPSRKIFTSPSPHHPRLSDDDYDDAGVERPFPVMAGRISKSRFKVVYRSRLQAACR